MRLSANKPHNLPSGNSDRRNTDGIVRFRNQHDNLLWTSVDTTGCDLNAVVYRGHMSENDFERRRTNSVGKFIVTSESFSSADTSLPLNDAEIRLNVSVSQLEKRGKMKHTEIETFLTIHRKSLSKEEYVIVHRSPKLMKVSVTSLQKFPEIVIPREKLLGGANDRLLRFSLRNAANGATIGEAEVYYSQLINDGKISLKLHSRDLNGNTLFGVSKRSLHHVGVLHLSAFLDNNCCCTPTGTILTTTSTTMSSGSRVSSSSTASTSSSTQDSRVRSFRDEDDLKDKSNVMMASGRTQAYLISLLAPTVDIRLRQPFPNRTPEHLMDRSYYK